MTLQNLPDRLSLREKIGQKLMAGFSGKKLDQTAMELFERFNPGFFLIFYRNTADAAQIAELNARLHSLGRVSPMIWTDQEGGTVVQFSEMAATGISHMGLGATGSPMLAERAGLLIGKDMKLLGIDGVLAPVLDVNSETDNPIIGIRSFSDDPEQVSCMGSAFARGLRKAGIASCGKHFPGHGAVKADSHVKIPECGLTLDEMEHSGLLPFAGLVRGNLLDCVMTGHLRFPKICQSREIATFSDFWIKEVLRRRMGFAGVVMSDCLEMQAVRQNYSVLEIAEKSVAAGIDVLGASSSPEFQLQLAEGLEWLVRKGRISEAQIDASVQRILKLKASFSARSKKAGSHGELPDRLRAGLDHEQHMADVSVTLLRNRNKTLPLDPEKKTLFLEWDKALASQALVKKESKSVLKRKAGAYFPHSRVELLALKKGVPEKVEQMIREADQVVAALFSRYSEAEHIQGCNVRRIMEIRSDLVVVSLGNPYDIRLFPDADSYIAVYGFRAVQVEGLLKVLSGKIRAQGRLPVNVAGIFSRGAGITG